MEKKCGGRANPLSRLELGHPSFPSRGHWRSWFSGLWTLGLALVAPWVLRILTLDWGLQQQPLWFSSLQTWTELCHQLSCFSSLQMAERGNFQPPLPCEPIPTGNLLLYISVSVSISITISILWVPFLWKTLIHQVPYLSWAPF